MDVGELPNAAGLVGRRAAVLGTAQSTGEFIIDADVNNSLTNTVTNRHTNSGWWIPTSGIVTSPTNTDVMNQLCRVCGEPAAGFHFGAFTCEGCKSFFGRTYNNLSSISECKNGGVCVINKKNRTSCKACRLRKCLMVGMSKSGSRYGRRSNWFKIHCLLQEQSHQAQQARLKDPNKSPFEKVLSSLDAANNNNNSGNSAAASGLSPGASQQRLQPRLLKPEDPGNQSRAAPIGPRSNMAHDLLRPDATFPIWRTPPFFHPAFSHMQFLNTSFLTFRQNFGVPYVNQDGPQIPITSISSSSSESLSPRSTPSEVQDDQQFDDKNVTFRIGSNRFGPEQDEPMDLSRKTSVDVSNDFGDNSDCVGGDEVILGGDNDVIESDTGPPLDLSWKT